MRFTQHSTFGLSLAMVVVAAAAFLSAAPQPVYADCTGTSCEFASQCYSHGACPRLDCAPGDGQLCWNAGWQPCETCWE
jgi:hypothetical protein